MQRYTIAHIVLFLVVLLSSQFCSPKKLNKVIQLNQEGTTFYKKKSYNSSFRLYKKAAQVNLYSKIPIYNSALALYKLSKYQESNELLENLVKFHPDFTEASYANGMALFELAMPQEGQSKKRKCLTKKARSYLQISYARFLSAYNLAWFFESIKDDAKVNLFSVKKMLSLKECPSNKNKKNQNKKDKSQSKSNKDKTKSNSNSKQNKNQSKKNSSKQSANKPPPKLSKSEQEKINQARKKIKRNKKSARFYQNKAEGFKSSKANKGKKKGKGGGVPLLW